MKQIYLSIFLLLSSKFGFSQLTTVSNVSINTLVQDVFLAYGLEVSNINYTGDPDAIGTFSYSGTHLGISQGLILNTGTVLNTGYGPHGPNTDGGSGMDNSGGSSPILNGILGSNNTFNSAVLEFDFVSYGDSIYFNYIFASEEYLEYVNAGFNDVFGLFISGPGISGTHNIALLPNHAIVSIDNVNNGSNSDFYVNNGDGSNSPYNTDPSYLQYDGFTTNLTAIAAVVVGETYHLTIAIADVEDGIMDSGIFLEGESLKSNFSNSISEELNDNLVTVFPNPAKDFISFKVPQNLTGIAKIIDLNGQTIQANIPVNNNDKIDIKDLENGVYILKIESNFGATVKRITVK